MSTQDGGPAILILGDDTRSFLSVARSFGRQGFQIDVCPFDFSSPALSCRYIRRAFHLPVYHLDPESWLSALGQIISDGDYAFIVPCDDRSILPIHRHQSNLPDAQFALPNDTAIKLFYDKFETRRLAQDNGVPVAAGRLLTATDTAAGLAEEFSFPLVIKPRSSYVIDNVGIRNNVRIVHNLAELTELVDEIADPAGHLVEQWVPGHGVGLAVLADHGRLIQAFEYHRVHEPQSGGGSSYRVSRPLNPLLVRYVDGMIAGSALNGVAMFEFRTDPKSGATHLMEVNARFWGGLPLAIAAGIDFPWLLYRHSVLREAVSARDYRTNCYARSLTADFYTVTDTVQKRARKSRFNGMAYLLKTAFSGACRMAMFRETVDTFSWADMAPFKAEFCRITGAIGAKLKAPSAADKARASAKAMAAVNAKLSTIVDRRPKVLFLCYGNICRSPFAELYLRDRFGDGFEVASSGVHPVEGRSSPEAAVQCAGNWGIDLNSHRSSHISAHDRPADPPGAPAVDLILFFDERNRDNLVASGYFENSLAVPLGAFLSGAGAEAEIVDPYGHGPEHYRQIYDQIARAVDALIAGAQKSPRHGLGQDRLPQ